MAEGRESLLKESLIAKHLLARNVIALSTALCALPDLTDTNFGLIVLLLVSCLVTRTIPMCSELRGCLKSPDSVIFHRLSFPIPASKQLGRTLVRAVSLDLPGLFKHPLYGRK